MKIEKYGAMIRMGNTFKGKNTTLIDSQKKFVAHKYIVNAFGAFGIGGTGVFAKKVVDGIAKIVLEKNPIEACWIITKGNIEVASKNDEIVIFNGSGQNGVEVFVELLSGIWTLSLIILLIKFTSNGCQTSIRWSFEVTICFVPRPS